MTVPRPLYGLLAVAALSPLPFAAVTPPAWGLMALVVGVLVVGSGIGVWRRDDAPPGLWCAVPFAAAVVWIVVQSTSWLAPAHHPLWTESELALRASLPGSIALDVTAAYGPLTRLLSYAGIVWLAAYYCRSRLAADVGLYAVAFIGGFYALYGLVEFGAGNKSILWYAKTAYLDSLTSTFINRNSFATYIGLTLICTSGLIARTLLEHRRLALRDTLLIALVASWFLECAALFLSGSRAGIASTLLALITLLAVVVVQVNQWQRLAVAGGMVVAILLVYQQQGDFLSRRLETSVEDATWRTVPFALTVDLIREHPLVGVGYGSFEDAFRLRRDEHVTGTYDKAHNTYLETALELGVPATILLVISLLGLFWMYLRGLRRPNRLVSSIGLAAMVLVAVHALVDFSIQIPAVAVAFSLLSGIAARQSQA